MEIFQLLPGQCLHIRHLEPVHKQIQFVRIIPCLGPLHHFLYSDNLIGKEPGIAVFFQTEHKLHLVLPVFPADVCKEINCSARDLLPQDIFHHIIDTVALDFLSRHRGICPAYPCEHYPQIVVDLGAGGDGGAWIACVDFLFDGYCRWNALYQVHIWLGHSSEELPGI